MFMRLLKDIYCVLVYVKYSFRYWGCDKLDKNFFFLRVVFQLGEIYNK